jgi:hypothetical protein
VVVVFIKKTTDKRYSLSIFEGICLIAAVYVVCYMLFHDDIFPMSINAAWFHFSHWAKRFHVLAVGLLPVYVSLMIFGTATIAVYLCAALRRWLSHYFCFF